MILTFFILALKTVVVFFTGTIVADFFHYFFHLGMRSRIPLLRKIGSMHMSHHQFFSRSLKIKTAFAKKNLWHHLVIEYAASTTAMLLFLFFMPLGVVACAVALQTLIFIIVCSRHGIDPHHKSYSKLPSSRGGFFVSAEYHALHHVYPTKYYSSYCKFIDYILGTAHHLNGKHIAMTGASGALGLQMKKLLEKSGAKVTAFKFGEDYTYGDYEKLRESLQNADILFLCHGSKLENTQAANCDSFVDIIELYRQVHKPTLLPLEVWGVGSEIEFHPCFGIKKLIPYATSKRNYARKARQYFHDRDIQYRHLVHSAFTSPMGPGLMTASFAARASMFFIKRDFKYIPVSYMGFAYLNYFRYLFNK